jgi:D-amino-acid dehydrogenase
MHVCVIGAGVVGLTTAYFLQSEGHSVSVVERERGPGLGASGDNGAQLSYAFVAPLADASIPFKLPGLLLSRNAPLIVHPRADRTQLRWGWQFLKNANQRAARDTTEVLLKLAELSREFIEPLIEGERIDCEFTRGGKLVLYPDARSLDAAQAHVVYQAALGTRGQLVLNAEQCVEREPAIANYAARIAGGVWTPTEAAADCGEFCVKLAALLIERGGEVHFRRNALRVDRADGRVRALICEDGPLRADAYVLAAGTGATALAGTAGLDLPILPLKGYSITVRPEPGAALPRASINDMRRRVVFAPLGNTVRVAGFVEIGNDDTSIPPRRTSALLEAAREVLGYMVVDGDLRPWAGLRPATPTGRPIIGRTPLANLYLNVGHGSLGWTLAAGSARLVCDVIADRAPTIALTPYQLSAQEVLHAQRLASVAPPAAR